MPEYSFLCERCNGSFAKKFSLADYDKEISKVKCPVCHSKSRVFRNYDRDNVTVNYVKGLHECKTLGEYADKQSKKMSSDHIDEKMADFKTKKDPNSGMKELPQGMSRAKEDGHLVNRSTKKGK